MAGDRPAAGEAWRDATIARRFASERVRTIPQGDTQAAVLLHVVRALGGGVRRILDLGCGDGVLLAILLDAHPDATGIALDYAPAMRALATNRLRVFGGRAVVAAADLRAGDWRDAVDSPVDLVVSGFAIHHLEDPRKRELFREIFGVLRPGGVFCNLEHVASAGPAIEALGDAAMVAFHVASRRAAGDDVDATAVAAAYHARPDKADNRLALVDTQCRWLREVGFVDVDCFWKWYELALFGGRTPCS